MLSAIPDMLGSITEKFAHSCNKVNELMSERRDYLGCRNRSIQHHSSKFIEQQAANIALMQQKWDERERIEKQMMRREFRELKAYCAEQT